ncbi:MAG: hypothetical protein ACKODP_07035 [Actinomycetota bacterium]
MRFEALRRLDRRLHADGAKSPGGTEFAGIHRRAALTAALVAGLVSLSVALRQYGPTVHPDEWGFLLNGRVIMGHTEAQMPTGSFYPAGFGLVTGPLTEITGSLAGGYRATLVVNFLLCVLVGITARLVGRRVFGMGENAATVAGALAFVVPGTIVTSLFAWPETAARLAFLVFVLWFQRIATHRRGGPMLTFGFFVGLMPGLHGRFTLVLPVVCCVFLLWGLRRETGRVLAVGACAATTVGYACSYLLNRFVKNSLYGASYDQENRLLRRLVDPSLWPALVRTMTGQSWYLVATTGGLVAVAVVWMVVRVRAGGGLRTVRTDPARLSCLVIVVTTVLLVFTGGLQLLFGNRGDHLIYGRYAEILVPVILVAGCAALESSRLLALRAWFSGAIGTLAVALLYVLVDMGDGVKGGWSRNDIVFPNIVGTDAMRYLVRPGLVTFGAAFALAGLLLWWAYRRHGAWAPVLMVVLLAAGSSWSAQRSILTRTDDLEATGVSIDYVKAAGGTLIGFDEGVRNDRSYYYLRYRLHPVSLVRFDISSPGAVIPAAYSCLYGFPNKPPQGGEWRIVADEIPLRRVLWQRVGTDRC